MKIINYCLDAFCSNLPSITLNRRTDNSVKKFSHCDNVLAKSVLYVEHCSLRGICSVLVCLRVLYTIDFYTRVFRRPIFNFCATIFVNKVWCIVLCSRSTKIDHK